MPSSADGPVPGLVDQLFRRSAGRLTAALTRMLGREHLEVAEEVVQEALLRALQRWPHEGVPANPEGWLFRVARNLALDRARRSSNLAGKLDLLAAVVPEAGPLLEPAADDELAMVFMCCHPAIPPESQVALTLKTVGGFSVEEVAGAFLSKGATIAQRLVRARRVLAEREVTFALPSDEELAERLDPVLRTLYLLFAEGYGAHAGPTPVRAELCREALRLVELVAAHPATARPEVHALAALMCLQASRLSARVRDDGALLRLAEQDRGRWDRVLITRGFQYLELAAEGDVMTAYHLEAGIAAAHAAARSPDQTDWRGVLDLYDQLMRVQPSPVAALNRAVAMAEVEGPAAGLEAADALRHEPALLSYYLLPATRAALLERLDERDAARAEWRRAAELARTDAEREWIRSRASS